MSDEGVNEPAILSPANTLAGAYSPDVAAAAFPPADRPLPTLLDLTPTNPAFVTDPHALFDDLRRRCPVHPDPVSGGLLLTRYKDGRAVLGNRELWKDPIRAEDSLHRRLLVHVKEGVPRTHTISIVMMDDPDHSRIRLPLAKALNTRVAKIRPGLADVVDRVLDQLEGRATFDLIEDFCVPLPIETIALILGVDTDRLGDFREWSEAIVHSLNPFRTPEDTTAMDNASASLKAYFTEAMAARRREPRDDLISDMVRFQAEGAAVDDDELNLNLRSLLAAGNLTMTDFLGNTVRNLLLHPDELDKWRADPSIIGAVVEEALRFEPPIDQTWRIAPEDMELGDLSLRRGQSVVVSLRAINRDPEAFENPHCFDVSRKRHPHAALGGGSHFCIGAALARLETTVALTKLFARFPDLKLARPDDTPAWRKLPFFRGLQHLEVAV